MLSSLAKSWSCCFLLVLIGVIIASVVVVCSSLERSCTAARMICAHVSCGMRKLCGVHFTVCDIRVTSVVGLQM